MVMISFVLSAALSPKVPRKFLRRKFIDSLRVHVKGGSGGNGLPKYGGVGGKGGDVYAVAKEGLTLKHVYKQFPKKRIAAACGENSLKSSILGKPGDDKVIEVPLGITVIDEHNRYIGQLDKDGDKLLLARGGPGGAEHSQFLGTKGQAHSVTLDLKIIADAGLVGFPNAGKSSLLRAISRAKPRVASYPCLAPLSTEYQPCTPLSVSAATLGAMLGPARLRRHQRGRARREFESHSAPNTPERANRWLNSQPKFGITTVMPEIGIVEYPDFRQISVADLPGLIEGAHVNIGLGHRFLKHVERTRLLVLVADVQGFQLSPKHKYHSCLDTVLLLNKELELYDESLLDKPAILFINKMDTEGASEIFESIKDKLHNLADREESLCDNPPKKVLQFHDVIPVSVQHDESSVRAIKERIRAVLDFNAELLKQENESTLLQNVRAQSTEFSVKMV